MLPRIPKARPALTDSIFAANALLHAVEPENVTLHETKAVVTLGPHWNAVFEDISAFGPVLSIARNTHAVLGRIGPYPKVFCATCGHCGAAADGTREYAFSGWDRGQVVIEAKPDGWLYALEFLDAWDDTLHKICLTKESDLEVFHEWVERNQAEPGLRSGPPPRGGCEESNTGKPVPGGELLRTGALQAVFEHLIEAHQPVQVVVGNASFVQGADLLPRELRASGQWIFVGSQTSGLHLRTDRLAEVCLQRMQWQENISHLVVKAFEPEGRLVCVLAPPRESASPNWDDRLIDSTEPFFSPPDVP